MALKQRKHIQVLPHSCHQEPSCSVQRYVCLLQFQWLFHPHLYHQPHLLCRPNPCIALHQDIEEAVRNVQICLLHDRPHLLHQIQQFVLLLLFLQCPDYSGFPIVLQSPLKRYEVEILHVIFNMESKGLQFATRGRGADRSI